MASGHGWMRSVVKAAEASGELDRLYYYVSVEMPRWWRAIDGIDHAVPYRDIQGNVPVANLDPDPTRARIAVCEMAAVLRLDYRGSGIRFSVTMSPADLIERYQIIDVLRVDKVCPHCAGVWCGPLLANSTCQHCEEDKVDISVRG